MSSRRALLVAALLIVVIVIVALVLTQARGGGGPSTGQISPSASRAATAAGKAGPPDIYPDPNLTPGDVFPNVTAQQVCTPGYASHVRAVSEAEKKQVYQRYGEKDVPGGAEVDHFISLELGGSNAVTNLWPERYSPAPGAHEKDKVENYLHDQVCSGALTLQQAQTLIRTDWYAVYLQIAGH